MRSIKLNAIKIARIGILAFCFIMAFAMIFASPASEVINDVAYAAEEGTLVRAEGDHGELTADHFKFPYDLDAVKSDPNYSYGTKTTWTFTETFDNFYFSTDSVSMYKYQDSWATPKREVVLTPGTGGFTFGFEGGATLGYQLFVVFNYDMSTFLTNLVSRHTGVTVKATASAHFDKTNGNNVGIKAMATDTMISGAEMATWTNGDSLNTERLGFDYDNSDGVRTSTTGTKGSEKYHTDLNADNPNLAIAFAHGGDTQKPTCVISQIKITFTITLNKTADSASTVINDNEAPIIAGVTGATPFRADNTNDNTDWNFTPSSSDITKNLEDTILTLYQNNVDYIDSKNNAYHNSYVDASRDKHYIDGNTDYEYYKSVSSVYTDTYGYGRKNSKGSKIVDQASNGYVLIGDGESYSGQRYSLVNGGYAEDDAGAYKYDASKDTQWFASGIKSVQIGKKIFYLYGAVKDNVKSEAVASDLIKGEDGIYRSALIKIMATDDDGKDVVCGWFRVTKTSRAEVYIETYFSRNGNFSVTVTDYGDKQITRAIKISGIDLHDPSAMETFTDDAKAYALESSEFATKGGWDALKWHNLSTLAFDFNEDETEAEAGHTPYMWFYSVVKSDTPKQLTSANWTRDSLMMRMPFAINNLTFSYDFETGYANPIYTNGEVLYGVDNQNGMGTNATGAGYYLFTFYKMDLSGRFDSATNVVSYYVKVDYDKATHTLEKSAGENDLANTDWAAGAPLVITLTQDKANLSGNTLTFNYIDSEGEEATANIFVKDGAIIGGNGNTFVLNEDSRGKEVTVTYALDGSGKAIWTVTFGAVPEKTEQGNDIYFNYNYVTPFDIATGVDLGAENLITYTYKGKDNEYQSGVYVRVDRNAPVAPNLMNRDELEGEYIVEISDFDKNIIPEIGDRSWFTDSWTFPGQFDFMDELAAEFGSQIKVYYAMKNVTSDADFTTGAGSIKDFVDKFDAGYADLATYDFDYYTSFTAEGLGDLNDLDLALNRALDSEKELGSGMRVFFFWMVDQAGNRSALNKYYILSDATTYYVTGHIDNGIFTSQTDVTMVSGGAKTAYKRGQSAVIDYAIDEDSPYVPYKLMVNSGNEEGLFSLWETKDPTSKNISFEEAPITVDGTTFTLFMDSVDGTLDIMETQDGGVMDVYFYFRELIDIEVLNNSVYYEGAPTTVPYIISNEDAIPFIEYKFKGTDGEGNPVEFATNDRPVDVGTYTFTMGIKTDHYITDEADEMDYYINKKAVTITINSTTGVYGDPQVFGYTVSGLVGNDLDAWNAEEYTFAPESGLSLPHPDVWILLGGEKLNEDNWADKNVGAYKLSFDTTVSKGALSDNYELPVLVEAKHTITQREIVVSVVSSTKTYGDNDGAINFTIDATTLPAGVNADNITSVIKNATDVSDSSADDVITMTGEGLITREAGEDVGEYAYRASASSFDTDSNYKIVIDTEGKAFTITKRTVTVTPYEEQNEKQNFVYTEEGAYDVVYTLDDYRYADALTVVWSFTQDGEPSTVLGFELYTMIVGAELTSSNANVDFVLTEGKKIIVKKALPELKSIVIVRTAGGMTKVYDGKEDLDPVTITAKDNKGFSLTVTGGDLPEDYSIVFTPTISGSDVGNYVINVDPLSVKVYDKDGNMISDYNTLVESYEMSITPATVTVYPKFTSTDKVYGDMDSAYGIGFAVEDNPFKSVDFNSVINGSFVRAIYNGADFDSYGERYDGVSENDGTFQKGAITYHYGVAVGNVFTSSNKNFVVEVADLSSYKLTISPKAIDFESVVDQSDLYANSKVFNNSANVVFGDNEKLFMFDVSNQLVSIEDDVHVDFTALFTDFTVGDNKTVQFSAFVLVGEDSANYVLVGADGEVITVDKTKDRDKIKITGEALVIEKRFFSITKVYDGTTTITKDNIVIDNDCMLAGVEFDIAKPISFNSADVTNNFATDLVLVFPGITESTFTYDDSAYDHISFITEGLRLSLSLVPGTITQREIALEDIVAIDAVDRTYNGKTAVDVNVTLKDSVYGTDDDASDVRLSVTANASSATVGTKSVTIDTVTVAGGNYKAGFTADELQAYANLDVEISRAKVELNVIYDQDKQYNGRDAQTLVKGSDIVKGDGNAFRLVSDIDMDATTWADEIGVITYEFDTVDFTYTIDGAPNANVAYSSGRVVKHNVSVSGLSLTTTNPEALNNYEIVAYVWDSEAGEYKAQNVVLTEGTIDDFECVAVAPMARKVIKASNTITVKPKVYDGTRTADAEANDMSALGVLPADADHIKLKFDATFETKNVGEQNVRLRIIGFENVDAEGEDIASNYEINSATTWVTRQSILPAPMLVSFNVGEKVYDGTTSIEIGKIKYDFDGMYAEETDSYAVNVLAAHYIDANVYDDEGDIDGVKSAKLYGIELKNLSTSKVNYYPVFASSEEIAGLEQIPALGALPEEDGEGNPIYYYPIATEQMYVLTATEYNALAVKPAAEYVIGTYTRAGKTYYIIHKDAAIDGHSKVAINVDDSAVGNITPKAVTIAVEKMDGTTAFDKLYDGTKVFGGELGTDYQIGTAGGFIGADNTKVTLDTSKYTVAYTSSNAGVSDIKFVFGDGALIGTPGDYTYLNYTATGASYVIKGNIKQREMTVILNDITATYGDDPSTYDFDLTYMIGSTEVTVVDGRGYVGYVDGLTHALGYDDFWTALTADEQNALRYNLVEGAMVQAADGAYVILSDKISTPSIVTNANKQTVVGTYKATLLGGSATNYALIPSYTLEDGSEVVIGKKTLTVSAKRGDGEYSYYADYLGALPEIVLSYAGFVNGDGANKITVKEGAVKFMLRDKENVLKELKTENGLLSSEVLPNVFNEKDQLDGGEYIVLLDATKFESYNYDIVIGTEAKLLISVSKPDDIVDREIKVEYNGEEHSEILHEAYAGASDIKLYLGDVEVQEIKNAGTYTVVATFEVTYGNKYTVAYTRERNFVVNKSNIDSTISIKDLYYCDDDFADLLKDKILESLMIPVEADRETVENEINIAIYHNSVNVSEIENVGNYSFIITLGENELTNYNGWSKEVSFKINPAPIVTTFDNSTNRFVASFDENGKLIIPDTIPIAFKVEYAEIYLQFCEEFGVTAPSIDISKMQVQFSNNSSIAEVMTGSGLFEFDLVYLEKNPDGFGTGFKTKYTEREDGYYVIEVGKDEYPLTDNPKKYNASNDKWEYDVFSSGYDIDGDKNNDYKKGDKKPPIAVVNANYEFLMNSGHGGFNVSVLTLGNEDFMIEYLDGVGIVASGVTLEVQELTEWVESDEMYNYFMDIDTFTPYVSTASHTATLEVVMHLRMMQNKNVVQPNGTVYVILYLYLEHDVDEYVFYQVGEDGYLHMLEDYTMYEDGYLEFTTDRIDSIAVFHLAKVEPAAIEAGFPQWAWYVIGGGGGAIVLASVVTGVVVGKKKKDKKKAEGDDTPDDTPDGDKPEEEKKEEAKPEEPKKEEVKPEPTPAPKAEEPKAPEAPKAEEPKAEPTPEPAPEPVKPRPSKPSVVGKKKPPVIGQKVMAEGVDPATAVSAAAPKATPAPKAAPAPQPATPAPKAEVPKTEAPKAETPKAPPVVGDKKPPVVGQKPATPEAPKADAPKAPPVVGKKPPVIGNK